MKKHHVAALTLIFCLLFPLPGHLSSQQQTSSSASQSEAQTATGAASPSAARSLNPQLPTLFVIGDSTANNSDHRGWGDPLADYFDLTRINVVNRARGGRSSRTFVTEGLWESARNELKPGDFVLIQFGHNDGGPPDKEKARGSLPGIGEESQEFTMPNGSKEVVHTFGWYMRKFITETKARGATPIVLSLTVRNIWKDGKVERGPGHFGEWSAEVAKQTGVAFVDLTSAIADEYEKMGQEKVSALFPQDHTHTSAAGADLNASLVVSGIKGIPNCLLINYLSAKGKAQPRAYFPASPPELK
ncbi:MAG TPA: rhamnogalacturonan acetylesterase [Terriglobales bacterium]|jgi:rhamnogalacturonan acetylesterase|nr:rhamnogalacturonan acetylesterase [Terriglobales bacterium]